MLLEQVLLGGGVAVLCGMDRTAALQLMISRPIVAGPLTGAALGYPAVGLQVGLLVELLWLGRLPMGAAIPPDDTQVAVGSTFLAVVAGERLGMGGLELILLTLLFTMPLGKVGQLFDRLARSFNLKLSRSAENALAGGRMPALERLHLQGMVHFALASLVTFAVVVGGGYLLLYFVGPLLIEPVAKMRTWLWLVFPLAGTAHILGTINVSRSLTLFSASFTMTLLMLWLV